MPWYNQRVIARRKGAYAAVSALLVVAYFPPPCGAWLGRIPKEFHTLLEYAATVLVLCVGALALVRYYSKNENTFLFIGTGFFTTGLLDGYHATITLPEFQHLAANFPPLILHGAGSGRAPPARGRNPAVIELSAISAKLRLNELCQAVKIGLIESHSDHRTDRNLPTCRNQPFPSPC